MAVLRAIMLFFISFFLCCGPTQMPLIIHSDQAQVVYNKFLPFESIKSSNEYDSAKKDRLISSYDPEQWRFFWSCCKGWRQMSPYMAYIYDCQFFKEITRQRYYPW